MSENYSIKPRMVTGFIQAEGGAYDYGKDRVGYTNLSVGAIFEKNGTYAKVQAGAGTSLSGKVEVGHNFPIGKHFGVAVEGLGEYNRAFRDSNCNIAINVNTLEDSYSRNVHHKWHDGYAKVGASAMINFEGKRGKIGFGVEGGYRTNYAPNISENENVYNHDINIYTYNGKEEGAYITPKIDAQLNLDKKGHWAVTATSTINEGNAGIKYTF